MSLIPTRQQCTVLVVEHNPWLRASRASLLAEAGFLVEEATNGFSGFRLAGDRHPDVIVLTSTLPDLSGPELLRQLKADRATAQIPVIVLDATVSGSRGTAPNTALFNDLAAELHAAFAVMEQSTDRSDLLTHVHRAANASRESATQTLPSYNTVPHVRHPRANPRQRHWRVRQATPAQ